MTPLLLVTYGTWLYMFKKKMCKTWIPSHELTPPLSYEAQSLFITHSGKSTKLLSNKSLKHWEKKLRKWDMNIAGCTVCNFKSVHTCVFLKKENIIVWVHWSPFMPHSFLSWMKVWSQDTVYWCNCTSASESIYLWGGSSWGWFTAQPRLVYVTITCTRGFGLHCGQDKLLAKCRRSLISLKYFRNLNGR